MTSGSRDILIVGGGPVGLYLGCLLRSQGVPCRIIERRTDRSRHSRSIGVHPPALERLAELGLADALTEAGIKVHDGLALSGPRTLGTLSFRSLGGPFPFVLAVPQYITEAHLEDRFASMGPAVERGSELVALRDEGAHVDVTVSNGGVQRVEQVSWVIGCDGKRSHVRSLMGGSLPITPYPGHYVMGDFPETTEYDSQAAIVLHRDGVVEAFPLPGGTRRWVARFAEGRGVSENAINQDILSSLVEAVADRLGHELDPSACTMQSRFQAERGIADRFAQGRVALAGDAAHVISPIGGQGMNLGWMDADLLALELASWFHHGSEPDLQHYERERKRSFRRAVRRSELNMFMGQPGPFAPMRVGLGRLILRPSIQPTFARLFTMSGL